MFGVQGYLLSSIMQRSVGMLETNRKMGRTWRGDRWGIENSGNYFSEQHVERLSFGGGEDPLSPC